MKCILISLHRVSHSVKHGTVKGLNPTVGTHDGNVSACGAFRIIYIVWMEICQKVHQCCQMKTCSEMATLKFS